MKATGIVRKVDELGRICLPKELRKILGIAEGTPIEVFTDEGGKVVLRKYEPTCIFCGNAEQVTYFNGKVVCQSCIKNMKGAAN